MGPTEAAADNVNESTIHSSLGIEIGKRVSKATRGRVRRLWTNKTIMIIDEISMIDAKLLAKIDSNCAIAKAQRRDINNFFGNIPIIILMRDFFNWLR